MPEAATELDDIYTAIEKTARLLDLPCSREKVQPVLNAYGDGLADAHIVFSMGTGKRYRGELSFDFSVPASAGDPRAVALSNGLAAEVDHPIRTLFADVQARCPVDHFGVDYGIVGGFRKTYAFFPLNAPQRLSALAGVPSMPPALAEHADFLAGHGLDGRVSALAIDYAHRTWNVYFSGIPAEFTKPKAVQEMIRAIGLAEPSEQMLEFIRTSFAMYLTFRWDSPRIERICFSTRTPDPMALPAQIEPDIATFAKGVPCAHAGERTFVYAGALSSGEEYYKLASYYQKSSQVSDRVKPAKRSNA
jgi:hypothetical protein